MTATLYDAPMVLPPVEPAYLVAADRPGMYLHPDDVQRVNAWLGRDPGSTVTVDHYTAWVLRHGRPPAGVAEPMNTGADGEPRRSLALRTWIAHRLEWVTG